MVDSPTSSPEAPDRVRGQPAPRRRLALSARSRLGQGLLIPVLPAMLAAAVAIVCIWMGQITGIAAAILAGPCLLALAALGLAALQSRRLAGREELGIFQQRLENLAKGSLQGIVIHRDHKPLFANQAYADMFGFPSPESLLTLPDLSCLISPEHREMMRERAKLRLEGKPVPNRYEFLGVRRDGRPIWIEAMAMVVPWTGGPAIQSTAIDISERKRAEEALRLSETSYRSLFEANRRILENSPAGIVLLDRDLRIVYENSEARSIYGLTAKDFSGSIGGKITDVEIFRGSAIAHAAGRLASGRRAQLDLNVRNLRGESLSLELQGVPILEDNGVAGAVVLLSDVTQRRRQEDALRKQDRLLIALAEARHLLLQPQPWAEALSEVIASLGRHMGVDHVALFEHVGAPGIATSRASLRLEWRAEGLQPFLGDATFLELSYRESGFSRWYAKFEERQAINTRIQDLPPAEQWLFEKQGIRSAVATPVFSGNALWGFIGCLSRHEDRPWSVSEVSILQAIAESLGHRLERDATERRLRESEEHFSRYLSQVPVMMFQYRLAADGGESFPFVSRLGLEALGLEAAALEHSAEPLHARIHPPDRIVYERLLRESFRTMQPKRWEGRYYNAAGEQRWAELIARPSRLDNGDLVWDGFIMDISGRKRAELEALNARERDATWNASRELITQFLPGLRELEAQLVDRAEGNRSDAVVASVRGLIQLAQAARPALVPVSLQSIVAEAARKTVYGTGLDYQLRFPPDLDRVSADPAGLTEIFRGLFATALQAMPNGGNLIVRADNVRVVGGGVAGLQPGFYVRIGAAGEEWADVRIAKANPVYPRSSEGQTGLAEVLDLVTAQHGWLIVHAARGNGALFTLYLPASTLEIAASGGQEGQRRARARS